MKKAMYACLFPKRNTTDIWCWCEPMELCDSEDPNGNRADWRSTVYNTVKWFDQDLTCFDFNSLEGLAQFLLWEPVILPDLACILENFKDILPEPPKGAIVLGNELGVPRAMIWEEDNV